MGAATHGTSESFGAPGHGKIQTRKPSHSYKVAQRRLLIILAEKERGGSERPIKLKLRDMQWVRGRLQWEGREERKRRLQGEVKPG